MKVFSIILRILSLGACGFAVYCWIDKKDLVAQKEAVIQEREFLSGYYDKERSPNSEVKQDKTTRDANFAKINERGGSDSLKALKGLEDSLKTIQKADEYFGHEAKTLGGPDPNNQLTLKGHILVQTDKIETQKGIIEKKTQEISGLENDVKEKDTLLGEKITENGQLKGNIEDLNETIQEKDNKYAQLQTNYLDEQKNHQTQIENLQESLKTQTEELKVTLAAKEEKNFRDRNKESGLAN